MERNYARFDPKTGKKEQKNDVLAPKGSCEANKWSLAKSIVPVKEARIRNPARSKPLPACGHDEEHHCRPPRLRFVVFERDQAVRQDRHQLPGREKEKRVSCCKDES